MLIAKQKKDENIAEYLLYMWQVEDIIRANKLNIDLIEQNIISKFEQTESVKAEIYDWYKNLIDMMKYEGLEQNGHLQINKNVIINLTDVHLYLLESKKDQAYIASYYKTLPFIVELRSKNGANAEPEIETCFSALYGYLMLKLQKKDVSGETQAAIAQISSFVRLLSEKYKQENK
ncbi:DUF4924 family protein [Dysgonomonas sp. 216]|uniref:DUF4924 family protein n=1 Tax=Dysgonomonas sp. 216 TaxID=2302934 RepID=UPI0013D6797D|nr:DUF4924 family protein [Dysgonomonas sp. 216]NDW19809.1 DUF4924 family protein [Dysgonomonas sp. 216]